MSKTGLTVDIGSVHADGDGNLVTAFNARWTAIKASLEAHLDLLSDGYRLATNNSGVALAAGDLVYRSGWDATSSQIKVKKAIVTEANASTFYATHVVSTGGANGATTIAIRKIYQLTAQNTSGLTAGRPVFLSTVAGGWVGELPTVVNRVQIVGTVIEVSATVGIIEFDLFGSVIPFGSADDV